MDNHKLNNNIMYKPFIVLALFLVAYSANAQQKALTETGREVILFDNGTWKYSGDSTDAATTGSDSITFNPIKFVKNAKATFPVKSNTANVGVYINTAAVTFNPHKENEVIPEYYFLAKSGGFYGMLITEKTPIAIEEFKGIALANASKASLDARITSAEYRTVNNKKVLCMELRATLRGIKFVYIGYYYSSEGGSVQFLTYTSEEMYAANKKSMEDFLNGFTVFEAK
jgi:hypothetical protein